MYGYKLYGLDRCPLSDPDSFESYEPSPVWPEEIPPHQRLPGRLFVPVNSRTVAGYRGVSTYRFLRLGSGSHAVLYRWDVRTGLSGRSEHHAGHVLGHRLADGTHHSAKA